MPTFTDDFNRANSNSLGANWTETENNATALTISGNRLRTHAFAGGSAIAGQAVPTLVPGQDQYVQVAWINDNHSPSTNYALWGLLIRGTVTSAQDHTGYAALFSAGTTPRQVSLVKHNPTTTVTLDGPITWAPVSGDVWKIEGIGNTMTVYKNGVAVLAATSSTYTAGVTAIYTQGIGSPDVVLDLDNWESGDSGVAVTYIRRRSFRLIQRRPPNARSYIDP